MTSTDKPKKSRSKARITYRGGPLDGTTVPKTDPSMNPLYRSARGAPLTVPGGDAILSGRVVTPAPAGVYVRTGYGAAFERSVLLRVAVYDFVPALTPPAFAPMPTPARPDEDGEGDLNDLLGI